MPYITIPRTPKIYHLTIDDILNGIDPSVYLTNENTNDTFTYWCDVVSNRITSVCDIHGMIQDIKNWNERHSALFEADRHTLYHSFKIPKSKGGWRQIDAPLDPLMIALRELRDILQYKCYGRYHSSAFAYIKGRCAVDAVKRHQKNESRWFLKLDFSNFFGSTTPEFVEQQLRLVYPFSAIYQNKEGATELNKALSLCFLNGGLPQGTPISPLLTNIMMIPIDMEITRYVRNVKPHLVYTRYADDLLISGRYSFIWSEVQNELNKILSKYNAPFQIKPEKTRYGSSAGRNWNLGVMLNKDNEITVGHKRKKQLKMQLFNFMKSYQDGNPWSLEDVQALNGIISYYRSIEKDNIDTIINSYSEKFNYPVMKVIKELISA